ncbi:MAG TPA: nitrite reductase (NAD(P)H), partial [Cellvibrio sp.]
MKKRIVVVGNGMVGHKFIDNLVNHGDADQYQVVTFSEEPRLAYDRVQLSKYFSGSTADDLMLTSEAYYRDHQVEFILKDKVVDLDIENKEV